MENTKTCYVCKKIKNYTEFKKHTNRDGMLVYENLCAECHNEQERLRHKETFAKALLKPTIENPSEVFRVCRLCDSNKPLTEYHKDIIKKDGYRYECKSCVKSYSKEYVENNKAVVYEKNRNYQKLNTHKRRVRNNLIKLQVYDAYGAKCACQGCSITNIKFLTIDHTDNDGYNDRRNNIQGERLYKKIIAEGFPPNYRILCWNCNCGRARNNGVCPHEEES